MDIDEPSPEDTDFNTPSPEDTDFNEPSPEEQHIHPTTQSQNNTHEDLCLTPGKKFIIDDEETQVTFVGMEFRSYEDAESNYNRYAKRIGFSVRIKNARSSKIDKALLQKILCCSREGHRRPKKNISKPRPITRCGCKAFIQINWIEVGLWRVLTVELKHIHELVSPQKCCHLRSQKQIPDSIRRLILSLSYTNLKPCQIYQFVRAQYSAVRRLTFTAKDCANLIANDRRKSITGVDAQNAINKLAEMKRKDDNFFYTFDIDESGKLLSMLWAHRKSRMDYKEYRDVIVFDSTYRTNVYGMPFAPFIGVNNHRQSILLGGALLSNETSQSYVWVFQQWLECMEGKTPNAIITDQDLAMKVAIAEVLPTSTHRYCIWHIMRKFRNKFRKRQRLLFKKCVYNSKEIGEFEEKWKLIIETEGLQSNDWLNGVYQEREHWVPAYLKGIFFAGMCSTQRSESMNSYLKAYLDLRKNLIEFIEGYDEAFKTRISSEVEACTKNINSTLPLKTTWPLESHSSGVYTNAVFRYFQDQVVKRSSFYIKVNFYDDLSRVYEVMNYYEHQRSQTVTYYYTEDFMMCSCKKFSFKGWPCAHMLRVMEDLGYRELPEIYISRRWTHFANTKYVENNSQVENEAKSSMTIMEMDIRTLADELIEVSCKNESTYNMARQWIQDHIACLHRHYGTINEHIECNMEEGGENNRTQAENNEAGNDLSMPIHNPILHRRKGRPPIKHRLKSHIEEVNRKKSQGGRACTQCHEVGHNIRTCKKAKKAFGEGSDSEDGQSGSE